MTSEDRKKSEYYWFGPEANQKTMEDFLPSRQDEPTILSSENQDTAAPKPIAVDLGTAADDVVRNDPEPEQKRYYDDLEEYLNSPEVTAGYTKAREDAGLGNISLGSLIPKEERGLLSEAGVGVARGVDQTQAMGFGLLGLMGEALQVEGLSDLGVDGYKRNMEEAAKNQASIQDPFEEIGGLGDAATYAAGILGEQLPQLLLSLGGGGIGGYTAKTIAKKVVANEIGKRVASGIAKEEAEKVVAKLVAQKALQGFTTQVGATGADTAGNLIGGRVVSGVGKEAMQKAVEGGAMAGAYVANTGQIAGGSFGQIEQETGLRDPVNALGFALLGGALETAGEAVLAAPIAKKLFGTAAADAIQAGTKGVESKALGFNLGPKARVAGQLVAAPATEGGTEYAQTYLEQAAVAAADPNRTLEEVTGTPQAERERLLAATAGAVAGGGFGGISQAASYLIPETAKAVQSKLQQRQSEQPPEAPSEPELTGEWSEPIQVDDLRMQRSSTGLWAVVNPDREIVRGAPTIQDDNGATLQIITPEADEEGNSAMLVAKAEKALSDLSEGQLTAEPPAQEKVAVDPEDELGEPAELDEETEATRLRQSPLGAQALRQQLADDEEVSAALAEPKDQPSVQDPMPEIKPAAESAAVIDENLSEEEALRRSKEGALRVREQALRQERGSSAAMQPGGTFGERLAAIKEARIGGDQEKILLQNFYNQRRKELETAKEEERKQREDDLARPLTQAAAFVDGLELNQRVGLVGYEGRGGIFMGRRKNGNAVFRIGKTSPASEGLVGEVAQIELKPSQFNRVTLAPRPEVTKTPLEQAFADALGPNPTKQQAERVLGSPYTGTRGAQESTFNDGLGEAFPIEVSWFNKKGEKGTIIPSIRGKFTNSPLNTVRQMNQGLEVVVPDEQLGSLSKDIQVEAVSDKKGGRKNIVTGVSLWGRTYRRSLQSPRDFRVDIPLTKRGAGARKQGLLLFDNIYKNAPERIARSQAAVLGREERKTPVEEQLKEWELVQAGLNPVEYTFYEDALARVTDFINRSNLPENVKDEARFEAQNSVVKAFANRKKRRGKQPAGDTADISKLFLESLAGLRQTRLNDARNRATRLIGNIERNPERMSDVEIARAEDANPLRGMVLGSVAGDRAAEIEERTINEAEKGNAVDLDRAVQATLRRLVELRPGRTTKQVFNDRASLRAVSETYKNLGKFNPIYTAMNAVRTADRSIRRREMNQQTELITDREARERAGRQRAEEPETRQQNVQGELTRAQQAETMQSADRAVLPEEPDVESEDQQDLDPEVPMTDQVEDARDRFFDMTEEDQDLVLRNRLLVKDERGNRIRGQKSNLTQAQKKRARQIEQYLQRKISYANLYPKTPSGPVRTRRQNQPAAAIPLGRYSSGEILSGVAESRARGGSPADTQGRPEGVVGSDSAGAGTVQRADNVGDGRPGVRTSLAPQTVRQLSRRAKRIFVESFGRLTDAESAVLTDAEIDRAHRAIVTRSNPAEVKAGKVVVGETPNSFADLAGLSASELLAGANAARRSADEARAVRENIGELLRARAFADVGTFLDAVQKGRFSQDMKLRAREFAKLARRGVDLNGVGVQISRFGGDTSWAGLFTRDGKNAYDIALNLDTIHDRGSAVNTFLHELSHVTTSKKVRGEIKLNRVEQDALNRLEALRREALVAAARELRLDVPATLTDADYGRLAKDLDNRSLPQNDPEGNGRVYAGLTNLEEFTTEVSSSPELADLMVRLGFGQAKGRVSLLNAVRDAWNALVELISGVKADPNSPLAKAFKDSWIINFSNAGGDVNLGEYTMPEVRRSAINMEIELINEAENFINREIEARNLEGTTEQRREIAEKFARRSPASATKRVRDAAQSMTEQKFVQWAKDNGFNFVDPVAVYNNNRTSAQGSRNTVQGAESRAVGSQVAVVPDGGVEKEFHTLNTVEDTNGDVGLDLSKLIESLRDKASQVSGEVFGKKFLVIADDERREFTTLPALQRFLANAGIPGGTIARVFRNANNQITVNFDENINQTTERAIREQNRNAPVQGAESRARRSVNPPVPSKAEWEEEIGEELVQANIILKGRAPLKLIKVRDDLDYDTSYISGTHIFKTPEGDIITASKEDGQWDMQSIFNGEISTFEEDSITNALERLSEELAEKRMMLAGEIYDEFIDMPKDHPFWNSDLAKMDLNDAPKLYRMIDYYRSLPKQPNNPDARESRAVRSVTETTYNGKTYTRPGLIFGENANLDPRATKLVADLKQVRKGEENFAKTKAYELNRLIRKIYKNGPVPTDLINDALGNLDNPLTDQQFDEIKRLELTDPEAAVKKRIAYLGENRARFRTERQAPALLALPEELAIFLGEIGDDLKSLQQQALDLGIPKGDMATAFTENLGIYLTRSYNAFLDQEGWERTLRAEDAALGEHSRMAQFRNTIRATLIGTRADQFMAEAMEQGRTLSRAEAERRAKEGTTTEEVDQMLESYIAYTKEEPSSESFSGLRLPGRQNIKSLEHRKILSNALREFYGQVENPAINFVTSYAKLSSLIANHKFQTDLKNLGLKEGWLWDQERNIGQRPPAGYERIAADNDKSLKVLAGLYARSDLVRGLRETFPPNSMEAAQWWLHPFMKLTGLSMGMKTVGSIASQIRNYWSSYAPMIAGGNFTLADLFRPEWRKNWKEAHGVAIANVFRQYKGDRKAITDRIKRLYELGVMGESLTVGLLNDLTRLGKDASTSDEQFFNNFEKILKKPGRRVWNATKQVWEKAEQIYGMTDDVFKVFTYLSEYDKYKRVYPDMSDAELEQKAANIARDIHWTYSKAPAAVNELKKFPFIAPFITFTTETIRITANLGKLAIKERRDGQQLREQGLRENNAELVRQGDELLKISNKRLRGMAAVAVGPWALGTLAATSLGFSGDDEEDLRQFLPDWQKNSQLIIIGKNGSEVNYVDVSYLDPFEIWKKPMTAFMRGLGRAENVEQFFTEAVVGAAIEAGRPFTSEQILSGAIMDVMRNRDANGRQVYNPQDTGTAIAEAVGKKLASAFAPGTLDTGDRIVKALGGQISETGRDYNVANEILGVPFGSRVSAVDASQALGFKASQFLRARRDARSIFNRDFLSRGSRSEADVISAYQRSNAGLRDVTEQLRREYLAAINLGVSPAKARNILRAAGLDRDSARMISTGIYRRLTPSEEQDRMAAPERKRAARQAIAETPQREVLFP